MVARREVRRRMHSNLVFARPDGDVPLVFGYHVHPPVPGQQINGQVRGSLPVAKLSSEDDDVYIVPLLLVVDGDAGQRDAVADAIRRGSEHFEVGRSEPIGGAVEVFRLTRSDLGPDAPLDAAATRATLMTLQELLSPPDGAFPITTRVAPAYGFLTHQTTQPSDDPEQTDCNVVLPDGPEGETVKVVVIDTGLWDGWEWMGPANPTGTGLLGAVAQHEPDPLDGFDAASVPTGFLGRAAGHGTFIAGILRQLVPQATLVVLQAASVEGLVDEPKFFATLNDVVTNHADVDIVVIASGGYALPLAGTSLAASGTPPKGKEWLAPILLRQGIQNVLEHTSAVIVMSAGNSGSSDPSFPAAFAGPKWRNGLTKGDDRLISVAALDAEGFRADFSNYGDPRVGYADRQWVVASAPGVRLLSSYVQGTEDPTNDPDNPPSDWPVGEPPYASWTGTSFSAPAVAGRIAEQLGRLRRFHPDTEPVQAWLGLQANGGTERSDGCGVRIDANVARARPIT